MINEQAALAHLDYRARRVIERARQHAASRCHDGIAPEHVLLALLAARGGMAARAVAHLAGSRERAADAIDALLTAGQRPSPAHLPLTAAAEEAMARAAREAGLLGDERIGTGALLLGLLAAPDNVAVRRLSELGVTYDTARAEILRLRAVS